MIKNQFLCHVVTYDVGYSISENEHWGSSSYTVGFKETDVAVMAGYMFNTVGSKSGPPLWSGISQLKLTGHWIF